MSGETIHEVDIKGTLVKNSGGGTLWRVLQQPDKIYKCVRSEKELHNIVQLMPSWRQLEGSDWIIPEKLVYGDDGTKPVGYIIRREAGAPLNELETDPQAVPLPDITRRVVLGMKLAMAAGIHPLVEHAGNIMVSLREGRLESLSLIDPDASKPIRAGISESSILEQLEIILLNYNGHPFHRTIFDATDSVKQEFHGFDLVVEHCKGYGRVDPSTIAGVGGSDAADGGPPLQKKRKSAPLLPALSWEHMPPAPMPPRDSLTKALDTFAEQHHALTKPQLLLRFVTDLSNEIDLSALVQAQLAYLFFSQSGVTTLVVDSQQEVWYVWTYKWQMSKGNLTRVKAKFQHEFLPAVSDVLNGARASGGFPLADESKNTRRLRFYRNSLSP